MVAIRFDGNHAWPPRRRRAAGFTLVELLIVVAVVGLVVAMLLPSLAAARARAQEVVCRSNTRELVIANLQYAADQSGHSCPGAARFVANLHRWHGTRDQPSAAFDGRRGPLVPYLGSDGAIRVCPSFDTTGLGTDGFERSAGGYGYNNAYLGVLSEDAGAGARTVLNDEAGVLTSHIVRPAATLMFADSAFAAEGLVEYSFAEPRFHPQYPAARSDPSIHFRHAGRAAAGWSDGHVDARERTHAWSSGFYPTDPDTYRIGWFGAADDNSLFDLQ